MAIEIKEWVFECECAHEHCEGKMTIKGFPGITSVWLVPSSAHNGFDLSAESAIEAGKYLNEAGERIEANSPI